MTEITQTPPSPSPQAQAPDLLKQAKAGDPKAIASLLNQSLHPRGITARAIVQDGTLRIMLNAQTLPQQTQLAPHLEKALHNLSAPSIDTIYISGFQTGFSRPTWVHQFSISPQPEPTVAAPEPLHLFLADLDEDTLLSLAQSLQIPTGVTGTAPILERIHHWQNQAQTLTDEGVRRLDDSDLAQMALCLKILQLHRLHPEDLMLLLAGL